MSPNLNLTLRRKKGNVAVARSASSDDSRPSTAGGAGEKNPQEAFSQISMPSKDSFQRATSPGSPTDFSSPIYEAPPDIKVLKRKFHIGSKARIIIPDDDVSTDSALSPVSHVHVIPEAESLQLLSTPMKGKELEDHLEKRISKILKTLRSSVKL